jgi:Protein of unknown function (DUF2844)
MWVKLVTPVFALPIFLSTSAFAALGGNASTIQADISSLNARMVAGTADTAAKANDPVPYAIQELKQQDGSTIREYVANNRVFGIAWDAPAPPNLHQLLGDYFEAFVSSMQVKNNRNPGHRMITIEAPGLVVHEIGHMRSFQGQAYVPSFVPPGVRVEDIR